MLTAAVRVGELACQRNTFLKELTATVLSCEPVQNITHKNDNNNNNNNTNKGKSKKQKGADNACNYGDNESSICAAPTYMYELVLSNSVLFP